MPHPKKDFYPSEPSIIMDTDANASPSPKKLPCHIQKVQMMQENWEGLVD